MKHMIHVIVLFVIICGTGAAVQSTVLTVAKDGSGKFTSVQFAVDAAGARDVIKILDNAVYEEQVSFDSTKI